MQNMILTILGAIAETELTFSKESGKKRKNWLATEFSKNYFCVGT